MHSRAPQRRCAVRDQPGDLGLDGQVRLQCDGPAAQGDDFGDHLVRFRPRRAEMDCDVPAPASKAERERAADPAGGAGNQHDALSGCRAGVDWGSVERSGHLQYGDESESSPTRQFTCSRPRRACAVRGTGRADPHGDRGSRRLVAVRPLHGACVIRARTGLLRRRIGQIRPTSARTAATSSPRRSCPRCSRPPWRARSHRRWQRAAHAT